jgi:NAD(P)-dependent dehydrogenase (short-subunit alcohol dehydrogenase family)
MKINPMDLSGKQILVAGAASDTGKAIILQLTGLGASTVIVDLSKEMLEEIKGEISDEKIKTHAFDIYSSSEIFTNLCLISERFGVFDGFVYCGGMGGVKPLSFTKPEFIRDMMNANLFSFIEMVRSICKKDRFKNGGSIVAISSVSSIMGLKSKTAYSASKAALDASIRCLAAELSTKAIRINSVLKGWLDSDMEKDFIATNMELDESNDIKRQLLGPTSVLELANTVAFLLSDATKTITGTALLIDGGYSL